MTANPSCSSPARTSSGLAFTPSRSMVVATNSALYRVDAGIKGRPLP